MGHHIDEEGDTAIITARGYEKFLGLEEGDVEMRDGKFWVDTSKVVEAAERRRTDELIDLAEQLAAGPPPAWDSMLETLEVYLEQVRNPPHPHANEDEASHDEVAEQTFLMLRALIEGRGHVAGLEQARADFREELRQADGIRQEGEDQLRALLSRAAIAKAVEEQFRQARVLTDRLFARVAEHREMLEGTGDGLHAKRLDTLEAWMPRFLRRLDGLQRQLQPEGSPQPDRPDGDHYIPDPLEVAAREVVGAWHEKATGYRFDEAIRTLEELLEAGS